MPLGWAFPGDQVGLVISVQVDFVCLVPEFLASLQLFNNVRITGSCKERRKPVETRHHAVFHLAGRYMIWPADDAWHTEPAFEHHPFFTSEGVHSTIGPGDGFGTVISSEY